jgi:hypothetical protein
LGRSCRRGDGTWTFSFQDVDPAYGANDVANWKVAGLIPGSTQ